jgi:FKBP-type peptidyl-prolyl cis-trans isomerase 2
MTVKNGDFIRVDFTESVEGEVIATTEKDLAKEKGIHEEDVEYGPRLIVVGSGQVVDGMEEDLVGKEVGYSGRVEIPPEKAFGRHDPEKVELISANKFKEERPAVGMRVSVDNRLGVVTRIIGRKVSVDFNHPLADKTIVYDYKILESVEDRLERLKGMIKTFAKIDLNCRIDGETATIYVPWELSYYRDWLMIRRGLAEMVLQHLGMNEVDFVERHTGAKESAEMVFPPDGKEAEEEVTNPG